MPAAVPALNLAGPVAASRHSQSSRTMSPLDRSFSDLDFRDLTAFFRRPPLPRGSDEFEMIINEFRPQRVPPPARKPTPRKKKDGSASYYSPSTTSTARGSPQHQGGMMAGPQQFRPTFSQGFHSTRTLSKLAERNLSRLNSPRAASAR